MKRAKHIEKLIRNLDIAPSDEMQERTRADAVMAHLSTRPARTPRFLPFEAIAAGLVLLGLLAALALHESTAPVYAVEQTVAAIKRVPVVHILGRDWEDKRIEMWIKTNPDTGLMDSCQVNHLDEDRFLVSTPRNTYDYDRKTNAVRIKDGPSIASIFCLGDFFRGIEDLARQLDGKVTYCGVTDPGTKRNLVELKMSAPNLEIVCLIDARTKLPLSIDVTRGTRFNQCDILRNATLIQYDDAPAEGLFDFTIPAGANITIETSQDPLQSLPVGVLRRCGEWHLQTTREVAEPQGIPVNTRLFFVSRDFALRTGGFLEIRNDSNNVWKGEIGVANVDPPNMAIFDAATGKKQQIRLVQRKQSPPGRFRVYWQLDEPLPPGQTRYGIYWQNEATAIQEASTHHAYPLTMNNRFGAEGIENFVLIVPVGIEVHEASTEYKSHEEMEGYRIYLWQRHLPEQMTVNEVKVLLSPSQDIGGRAPASAVVEWDPKEKVEPYTITMDDPNDPNMVELRTKYGLEDLVRGAADDYEKLKRVTAWVQKQWQHNGDNSPSKSDPLTILQEVSEGKRFRCVEYAIVVTGCTRSLGMSSRTLGLMRSDVETAESSAGHVVAEVWLQQFGKWVMVDGQWGALAESKGVPLNAVELQDAIARKDPGLTIRFVSGTSTADRQTEYIHWIIPYLYYFNCGCDQRCYRSAARGQPPQRGRIILVPKGAKKPKAFQRHASFQDATYISNPRAFYPALDKAVTTPSYKFGTKIKATPEKN